MLFSVGHSTLSSDEFLALVAELDLVIDVRSYPGSRRVPHFAREAMEQWLPAAGIQYRWVPALGGRRRLPAGAAPGGWESEMFAAYAWAMAEPDWLAAADEVLTWAAAPGLPMVGLLCSEAVWWRCHRSMIADYVVWRGLDVVHLQPQRTRHREVIGDRLSRYPASVVRAWEEWKAGSARGVTQR